MNNWRLWAGAGGVVLALLLGGYALRSSCSGPTLPGRRIAPDVAAPTPPAPPPTAKAATPAPVTVAAPAPMPTPMAAPAGPATPATPTAIVSSPFSLKAVRQTAPITGAAEQRRARVLRLSRIALALEDYAAAHGSYPAAATTKEGQPLLSWRVALLPYLGYQELYAKFKLDEPWDSDHNRSLVFLIPSVYQAPESPSERTPFVVPAGPGMAFEGLAAHDPRTFTDGAANSAILLSLDAARGVIWTEPKDFAPATPSAWRAALGAIPDDGPLVALGGGLVTSIPDELLESKFPAILSTAGQDGPHFAEIYAPWMRPAEHIAAARPDPMAVPFPGDPPPALDPMPPPMPVSASGMPADVAPFLQLAAESLRKDRLTEGYHLLQFSAIAASDPALRRQLKWFPALKRPAFTVRWGVGIEMTGLPNLPPSPITWMSKIPRPVLTPSPRIAPELKHDAGELAERMLEMLQGNYADEKFGSGVLRLLAWSQKEKAKGLTHEVLPYETRYKAEPQSPIVVYLGKGSLKQLGQAAKMSNVDAMLIFEVDLKPMRTGQSAQNTTVRIYDPAKLDSLAVSAVMNTIRVQIDRQEKPHEPDPVIAALERVAKCIEEQFVGVELPASITAEAAQRRVEGLSAEEGRDVLAALLEIRLYHDRKLISDDQLLKAYQRLLGDVAGSKLFSGKPAQQYDALAKYLPKLRPIAATAAVRNSND